MEWKWTKGEPYERSRRISNKVSNNENSNNKNMYESNNNNYENNATNNNNIPNLIPEKNNEDLAFSYSLNHDENTWEILNQSFSGFRQENKRADTDKRLAERQMFAQVNMNPYLVNNDYVNDIETHNHFMKPLSTSLDREKGNEISE